MLLGASLVVIRGVTKSRTRLSDSIELVTQTVKKLPAMQETRVRSLGGEDPLEKRMATPSRIILGASLVAQLIKHLPAMQETWVQFLGKIPWRRKDQPTPALLPGEPHG